MKVFVTMIIFLLSQANAWAGDFKIDEIEFISHEVTLSGSVVLPSEGVIHSAVVFVHGSGKQIRNIELAKQFASEGIAALVYDKRGAGKSGGIYESKQSVSGKNIALLADDAAAALQTLSLHPHLRELPLGLTGISQAGWIVPLAAEKSRLASYMVLWSGPVCKVSEEDIFSKYTADLDSKTVPSYQQALAARKRPYRWPDFLGKDSNPIDSLTKLEIRGLWIFGKQDGSVPVDLSMQRLEHLCGRS